MSNPRYGSGRTQFIGQGIDADLNKLDPAAYPGAVVYSQDELYYSNGSEWLIPQDTVEISRPRNQTPTTTTQQTQLRLSTFNSPAGETQTGIVFQINADGIADFSQTANLLTRTVTSTTANLYEVLYPDDGFAPGDVIWWRAQYLGTNGTQSQFSLPSAQVYPALIEIPQPVTRVDQIVGQVEVTAFESPPVFGLTYYETQTEFYADGAVPGVDTPITTVTHINDGVTILPDTTILPEGLSYQFRSRYGARVSVASPVIYSDWSPLRRFFAGAGSMLLEYNLDQAAARTVYLPLGVYDATGLDVEVNWGDGTVETFTTGGIKSHVYAAGVGPIVNVSISGTMRQYGGNTNIQGLKRVDNWGLKLGLTSLQEAFRNVTSTLEYVNPNLPQTVTSLAGMLRDTSGTLTADITTLDVSRVRDFSYMFFNHKSFNQAIGVWDVSSATNMSHMFATITASSAANRHQFNQPLSQWDVSSVTNMSAMFGGCAFNQNIGAWNVSSVTDMSTMFGDPTNSQGYYASAFNNGGSPSISDWDVSSVTNMSKMFGAGRNNAFGAPFNQPIGNWNVSNVTNMGGMFKRNFVFNQPLADWDTGNVTLMNSLFEGASSFNQPIGSWNVSNVTNMSYMFMAAAAFDQDLGGWERTTPDVSTLGNVIEMHTMFYVAGAFNNGGSASINNWNVSNVISFGGTAVSGSTGVFSGAHSFNQPIGNWDVSSGIYFATMLASNSFSQDISGWVFNPTLTSNFMRNGNTFGLQGMSVELYSRLLVGWANTIEGDDAPFGAAFIVTGPEYDGTIDFSTSFPGARFSNATDARAWLVGSRSVIVSGSAEANANGTFNYNAALLTYDNPVSGWYFIRVGTDWQLRDDLDAVQDSSGGNQLHPWRETGWTTDLLGATVLSGGAYWTISGDASI